MMKRGCRGRIIASRRVRRKQFFSFLSFFFPSRLRESFRRLFGQRTRLIHSSGETMADRLHRRDSACLLMISPVGRMLFH